MTADEIKRSEKAGLPPGTLMYVGDKPVERSRITVIDYDEENFLEKEVKAVEECFPFKDTATVTWINVDGVRDADVIGQLGARFDIHPLILEDIMTTTQRPKVEDLGQSISVVLRLIECGAEGTDIRADQLCLIIGPNFVLSFQETPGDCLGPVRERIRGGKGRTRSLGPDYLAYSLIDAVVDNYFFVLGITGVEVEAAASAWRGVQLAGSVSWLDATYDRYLAVGLGGLTGDAAGHRLNNAPEWSGSGSAAYEFATGRAGFTSVRCDVSGQSRVFFTPFNTAVETQAPYALVHLRAGFEPHDRRWELSGCSCGTWPTRSTSSTSNIPLPAFTGQPGEPRMWGTQFTLRH